MKISEVRSTIEDYSKDQLKLIVAHLYKAIPKAVKEENNIDGVIADPDSLAQPRPKTRQKELPDTELLKDDAETFIEDAYNQYYFAPNQFVHKRDRPKWRFIVKRFYKDILASASDESSIPEAAALLEKLYKLLCHSCAYILFSAYDPFQSVGIEQAEFLRKVLALKYQCQSAQVFIKGALLSLVNDPLNRYTLHKDLMEVILEFTKTTDLKEATIAQCGSLIATIKSQPVSNKDNMASYAKRDKINMLTVMAFLCYARLYEYANAISYFKANYREADPEVALYLLLKLLYGLNQKDYFLQEYKKAVECGVNPRDSLKKAYNTTKEQGELPADWR